MASRPPIWLAPPAEAQLTCTTSAANSTACCALGFYLLNSLGPQRWSLGLACFLIKLTDLPVKTRLPRRLGLGLCLLTPKFFDTTHELSLASI